MAFSQATITDGPRFRRSNADLVISWASSSPEGTWFQLYQDRRLIWSGTDRSVRVAYPVERSRYEVGTVLASEARTDLSGSLPAVPGAGDRARITWAGGTFLADDIAGYRIYSSAVPGGPVVTSSPVAAVPAYDGGIITDGFGMGGFGTGGFGRAPASYEWVSGPLAKGTWQFSVAAYDAAGNEVGTPASGSVAISGPPAPPARDAAGQRIAASVSGGAVTLSWLASPG